MRTDIWVLCGIAILVVGWLAARLGTKKKTTKSKKRDSIVDLMNGKGNPPGGVG